MGLTPRLGLEYFGEDVDGSFTDNGSKYTYGDRLLLDRVITAIEAHNHQKPTATPVPTAPPYAVMGTNGTLPAGRTYYYGITFVDALGLETRVGELVEVSTPDILEAPGTPQVETADGGTLAVGTYLYALTALRGEEESVLSDNVTAQVVPGSQTVVVTMPDFGEADLLRVWRIGPGDPGYTKIGETSNPTLTDDGTVPPDPCSCDPENLPPTGNAGIALYSFTVSLSTPDAAVATGGQVQGWRLYRSEESGVWPASALVHYTVERTSESDPTSPLVTSWVDDGDEILVGQPSMVDQTLHFQPFSFPIGTTLPDPTGYDEGYPFLYDYAGVLSLLVVHNGNWVAVSGSGGGGGGPTTGEPFQVVTADDGTRSILTGGTALPTQMPGPPTPPSIDGFNSTSVGWSPPANDGGTPVLEYLVRTFNQGTGVFEQTRVPTTNAGFTFPEPVVNGVIQVIAVNAVGWSLPDEVLIGAPLNASGVYQLADQGVDGSTTSVVDMGTLAGDVQVLTVASSVAGFPDQAGWTLIGSDTVGDTEPFTIRLSTYVRTVANDADGAASVVGSTGLGPWLFTLRTYRGVQEPTSINLHTGSGLTSAGFFHNSVLLGVASASKNSTGLTAITPDPVTTDPVSVVSSTTQFGLCSSTDASGADPSLPRTATVDGTSVVAITVTVDLAAIP